MLTALILATDCDLSQNLIVLQTLFCPWDRRLILASARKLANIDEFKHVFIKPDQSL